MGEVRGVMRGHSPDGVETDAVIVQHHVETEGAHHHRVDARLRSTTDSQ